MFKGNDTGFTKNIFVSFLCLFLPQFRGTPNPIFNKVHSGFCTLLL
jgi:hypothetical protein